jgi:hypothetical protein
VTRAWPEEPPDAGPSKPQDQQALQPRTVVTVSEILDRIDRELPVAVAAELSRLRAGNARLLRLLDLTGRGAPPPGPAQAGFFEAPPGPVRAHSAAEEKVAFFGALFAARTDVYAVRYDNRRAGKTGWVPAMRDGYALTPRLPEPALARPRSKATCSAG